MKFGNRTAPDPPTTEILWATEFLRSRLLKQAQIEGVPLSGIEIEYLQNCHLEGDAWRELDREFTRVENPVDFQSRMTEILRRAYRSEIAASPEQKAQYLRAIELLEGYWPEFELWSIAVPALADHRFPTLTVRFAVVAIVALTALVALGVWWRSR